MSGGCHDGTCTDASCCALQGPPGTGKTNTIVALVSALLGSGAVGGQAGQQAGAPGRGPKVLVCAQSNAAVDELALRLSRGILDRGSGQPRCPCPHCCACSSCTMHVQ